jgi:hypothetical protein
VNIAQVNLLINKKATFAYTFYVLDVYNDTKLPNDPAQTPVDLTNCTGNALVKDKVGGTTLATFTVTFPNPTLGEVLVSLTPAQTSSLAFTRGVWDIFITFPSGKVEKFLEGNVILDLNVS